MKNRMILGFVLALILCSFGYGQSATAILGMDNKPSKKNLEAEALEYFQAILDEDAETIFKYVHPDVLSSLGSERVVIEMLKFEFEFMKKEGLEPVSVSIVNTASATDNETPLSAVVTHSTIFRTAEGVAEFTGGMKVYTTGG